MPDVIVIPDTFFRYRENAAEHAKRYQFYVQCITEIKEEFEAQWGVYARSKLRDSFQFQDYCGERDKHLAAAQMYATLANLYR